MSPYEDITGRLKGFKRTGPGRGMARCPAHKDRRASLSVREFDTGAVGLHCFAGCTVEAVVEALGLRMENLFPPRDGDPARPVRGERRPYSVREMIEAFEGELLVAFVLLCDVDAAQSTFSNADRERAGVARERILALMAELRSGR